MRRPSLLLLLTFLLLPQAATAIQLHWADGSTDITTSSNTQALLVVQADSVEMTLPNSWRLQWTADSLGVQFSAFDPNGACLVDTAKVDSIIPPQTPADSAANLMTATFCSSGAQSAASAYYLVDVPGGGHGKLKVVALNRADTTQVIESNEVTFNGGIGGDYAPVVLGASSIHQSLQLSVSVVGADLNGASSLNVTAQDGSWSLPLLITARGDSAMTGVASVAALLPACEASVGSSGGSISAAPLEADQTPDVIEGLGGCSAQYWETILSPPPYLHGYTIQPKDFSFTFGFVDSTTHRYGLHLFYIRHNYWYDEFYDQYGNHHLPQPDLNEQNIGHVKVLNFDPWQSSATDTAAISTVNRTNKFDALHVWAPTIVHPAGPTFHMFYTGVRADQSGRQNQSIGVAISTSLDSWAQQDSVQLSVADIPWALKNPRWYPYNGSKQLRDPFVMEDPTHAGQWLMYFVSLDSLSMTFTVKTDTTTGLPDTTANMRMAVGLAKSMDLRHWTALPKPFGGTEKPTSMSGAAVVESPHVFRHNNRWWMPYTVDQDQVFFETGSDPTDTTASKWTSPIWLRGVAQNRPEPLHYWHATEHLGSGTYEYLAAFNDNASSIDIMGIFATDSAAVDSFAFGCPANPPAGVGNGDTPRDVRLVVTRASLGASEIRLRMELPTRMPVWLSVYDIAGRRRAMLVDRDLPHGITTVKWDERGDSGERLASGVYFVRLTCAKGARVSKLVMLH